MLPELAVVADLVNRGNEFDDRTLLRDPYIARIDVDLEPAPGQCAAEYDSLRRLRNFDEPARAIVTIAKPGHVDITGGIHFCKGNKSHVKAATGIEIEHVGLVDDGLRIVCGAEVESLARDAAEDAGLHR